LGRFFLISQPKHKVAANMTPKTILLRQAHPNFVPDGQLSSQAFFPFPKDNGHLSVYDGDQISAGEAFQHYVNVLHNQSCGVWGVAQLEVSGLGLAAKSDALEDFPSHASIVFADASDKECRKLAKKLRAFAVARGCLHCVP